MNQTAKWSIVIICMMLIWGSIVWLFYAKADEVTRNPCSICAERIGEKVTCFASEGVGKLHFLTNGSTIFDEYG